MRRWTGEHLRSEPASFLASPQWLCTQKMSCHQLADLPASCFLTIHNDTTSEYFDNSIVSYSSFPCPGCPNACRFRSVSAGPAEAPSRSQLQHWTLLPRPYLASLCLSEQGSPPPRCSRSTASGSQRARSRSEVQEPATTQLLTQTIIRGRKI